MALVDAIANVITTLANGDLFYVGEDLTGSYQDGQVAAGVIKTYVLTGPLAVVGSATAGAELRLPEDTDNGAHYVALKAPDSLAATYTLTFPANDGDADQYLKTDGSGGLSWATVSGASVPLTLAGGTVTDPSAPLTITQTWNDAADTFIGLDMSITRTAAAEASRYVDFKLAGSSVMSIRTHNGRSDLVPTIWGDTNAWLSLNNAVGVMMGNGSDHRAYFNSQGFFVVVGNADSMQMTATALIQRVNNRLSWCAEDYSFGTVDTAIARNAAGVVEVNNGTNGTYRDLRVRNARLEPTVVGSLVAAGTAGAGSLAYVTDATATTARSTVAGGGGNAVLVMSNGTNWLIVA